MQAPSLSALTDLIDRAERADPALDAALAAQSPSVGENIAPLRTALVPLARAQAALVQANIDIDLVADELRRYQKFAPPGRPSVQIVQLRRQQSTVQQAQRIARHTFIRNADGFARAIALDVPQKLGVVETVMRWLRANLA